MAYTPTREEYMEAWDYLLRKAVADDDPGRRESYHRAAWYAYERAQEAEE